MRVAVTRGKGRAPADVLKDVVKGASTMLPVLKGPKAEVLAPTPRGIGPVGLGTLTARQEVMAEAIAQGRTGLEAYRLAFDCPTSSDRTLRRKVTALVGRPAFKAKVEEHRARIAEEYKKVWHKTARDITAALWREAESAENGGSVRVRALELLGKDRGMFKEGPQKASDKTLTVEEAESQIRAMLETYLGGNALIINDLDK